MPNSRKVSARLLHGLSLICAAFAPSTFAVEIELPVMADASVSEASPTTPFGMNSNLVVGEFSGNEWRTYVRWDTSVIPAEAQIDALTLRLHRGCSGAGGAFALQPQNIDTSWTESTVVWNTKPSVSSIPNIAAFILPACSVATFQDIDQVDGDPLVEWLQGVVDGNTSYGLAFTGVPDYTVYDSREGGDGFQLFVTYTEQPPTCAPTLSSGHVEDKVDTDDDDFYSQFDLRWTTAIACGSRNVYVKIFVAGTSSPIYEGDSFFVSQPTPVPGGYEVNVTDDISATLTRSTRTFTIRVYDASTNEELDHLDVPVNVEPGSDVRFSSDRLPNGKWTVIIHGLSGSGFGTIANPFAGTQECDPNWMWRLADKIRRESSFDGTVGTSNVLIRTHTPNLGEISDEYGAALSPNDIANPTHHQVLLVDWTQVSNLVPTDFEFRTCLPTEVLIALLPSTTFAPPGAQGYNGYAEATADALFALVDRYGIAGSLHTIIGYSRGAVVATELTQRVAIDGGYPNPPHVIFLDGEGGGIFGCLYTDDGWGAWANVAGGQDTYNYHQGLGDPLGGHDCEGAFNYTTDSGIGRDYKHRYFNEYLITGSIFSGCGEDNTGASGVFVYDHALVTVHTPSEKEGIGDDVYSDAPGVLEVFNGDFDFGVGDEPSTAGWWYHGGSPEPSLPEFISQLGTLVNEAVPASGSGSFRPVQGPGAPTSGAVGARVQQTAFSGYALRLNAQQFRRHNWMRVPSGAQSVEMDVAAIDPGTAPLQLAVEWWPDFDGPSISTTFSVAPNQSPVGLIAQISPSDDVGLLVLRNTTAGGDGHLLVDNVRWSMSSPPSQVVLNVSSESLTVEQGHSDTFTVFLTRLNAAASVVLSASNLPAGVLVEFDPSPASGSSSTATISIDPNTPAGQYLISIDGTAAATEVASADLMLEVTEPETPVIRIVEQSGSSNDGVIEFLDTPTGDTSEQEFCITNDGSDTLHVTEWRVVSVEAFTGSQWQAAAGEIFSLDPTNGIGSSDDLSLPPAGPVVCVSVLFTPAFPTPYRASVEIDSDDPALPTMALTLYGDGFVPLPGVPTNVSPSDGNSEVQLPVSLTWTEGDRTVHAKVYVGLQEELTENDLRATLDGGELTFSISDLECYTEYFWKIVALNSAGATSGDTWSFSTDSACFGDLDGDCDTDVLDFAVFLTHWDAVVAPGTNGDFDENGHVDVLDFALWLTDFDCPYFD